MKRYAVQVVTGFWFDGDGNTIRQRESHYFDSPDEAERFRKWTRRRGTECTDVMDLENLPF